MVEKNRLFFRLRAKRHKIIIRDQQSPSSELGRSMGMVQGLKNGAEIFGVFERHEMDPIDARIVGSVVVVAVSYQQQIL